MVPAFLTKFLPWIRADKDKQNANINDVKRMIWMCLCFVLKTAAQQQTFKSLMLDIFYWTHPKARLAIINYAIKKLLLQKNKADLSVPYDRLLLSSRPLVTGFWFSYNTMKWMEFLSRGRKNNLKLIAKFPMNNKHKNTDVILEMEQ